MEGHCASLPDEPADTSCICRPLTPFEGIELEHYTLGVVQLLKAGYIFWWLRVVQRRTAAGDERATRLLVLPVYARFLVFEAWQCVVWGLFFLLEATLDDMRFSGRGAMTAMQLARYLSSFSWALCGEGIFIFLTLPSAGIDSLHAAIRTAACYASGMVAVCGALWIKWAGCSRPPASMLGQLFWVGAWVPYWMRLCAMLFGYPAAALLLALTRPQQAWDRGAIQLALFNFTQAALFLLPKLFLGVFTPSWLISDALTVPLTFVAYVPFLISILERDSRYWARCGFSACVLGTIGEGSDDTGGGPTHRVPLLRSSGASARSDGPRFIIVEPARLHWGKPLGRGSSSVVSAATLYGEPVAVKQMEVSQLTREFAAMFLTEAECLSHCVHPNIVRFVGGCVAPPLVCLVMERCESSVHRLIHPRNLGLDSSSAPPPLPPAAIAFILSGVVSGMAFLHSTMGIWHGDLKPLNMLLTDKGVVKLCDFGCSRLLQQGNVDLSEVGTLPYMAPELLTAGANSVAPAATGASGGGGRGGGWASSLAASARAISQRHSQPRGGGSLRPPTPARASSLREKNQAPAAGGGSPRPHPLHSGTDSHPQPLHSAAADSADVFSFGVCVWEMHTRAYPWRALLEAGRTEELRTRVGHRGDRLSLAGLPPTMRTLVQTCWSKVPSQRPSFSQLDRIGIEKLVLGSAIAEHRLRTLLDPPSSAQPDTPVKPPAPALAPISTPVLIVTLDAPSDISAPAAAPTDTAGLIEAPATGDVGVGRSPLTPMPPSACAPAPAPRHSCDSGSTAATASTESVFSEVMASIGILEGGSAGSALNLQTPPQPRGRPREAPF